MSTARLLQPPALGTDGASGTIESVADRDLFQVLSPMRGTLTVNVTTTTPASRTWQGETVGVATVVQGTTFQGTVTVAGRGVIRPAGVVPEGDGSITLLADGGALGLAPSTAYNDMNIAAARLPGTVESSVEFDVRGSFGSSHNWGQVLVASDAGTIQLNFQKPDMDCGDIGGGVNPNFCLFVTGGYQSPYVLFVGPFAEETWHHVAIAPDGGGNLLIRFDGQIIGTLAGQGILPGSELKAQVLAGAGDRYAQLQLRNVVVDGTPVTPSGDPTLDTFLRVYDARGNLIAVDDDGGDGRDSTVSFPAGIFDAYFVEVGGYGDNSIGSYRVEVRSDLPPAQTIVGTYDGFDRGHDTERWLYDTADRGSGSVVDGGGGNPAFRLEAVGNGATSDDNHAAITMRATVTGGVEFDLRGSFGGSHNWGQVSLTNGTFSIDLNFEKPQQECGDTSGAGVNPNFCIFVEGYQWPTSTPFVAPFVEDVWHHFAIQEDVFPLGETRVNCNATDAAGNPAVPTTFTVTVTATPPSIGFSGGVLTILGTVHDDLIRLLKVGRGFQVETNFGSLAISNRKSLKSVFVEARGGNDSINLSLLTSAQTASVDGGSGDDSITAGAGIDILLGGIGNDTLIGSLGDNLMIGGEGTDQLVGSRGSDVLVGGRHDDSFDTNILATLLTAWRRARTAAAKQAAVQSLIDHVLDDGAQDVLTGGAGIDLFVVGDMDEISDFRRDDRFV